MASTTSSQMRQTDGALPSSYHVVPGSQAEKSLHLLPSYHQSELEYCSPLTQIQLIAKGNKAAIVHNSLQRTAEPNRTPKEQEGMQRNIVRLRGMYRRS